MAIELITLVDPGGGGLINKSGLYWVIRSISAVLTLTDGLSLPGSYTAEYGIVEDPSGNVVSSLESVSQCAQQTSATSGVYGFSAVSFTVPYVLVLPGYSFRSFGRAIAYQGTFEELAPLMHG